MGFVLCGGLDIQTNYVIRSTWRLSWILRISYSNITTQERENATGKMSLEKVADIYRIYEERRKKG